MIRHRPLGSGHPYSDDTDQRTPAVPVAGEPLRLGVRTSGDVLAVECEIVMLNDGAENSGTIALTPVARSERGQLVDGGHLASAQARLARRSGGWSASIPATPAGRIRYRFTARHAGGRTESTRWFEFSSAAWLPAPRAVAQVGVARLLGERTEALVADDRVARVRFALPLQPGEHVTGLGERYDALDHRGAALDSAVFEQYKSQGAGTRTYFPMPFAHVVGGEGWGFHLRTTRRAWFDFGRTESGVIRVEAELDAPASAGLDALVELRLYAGRPHEVLAAFLDEVGRPEELPDWVFRLWASGNEWNTQAEVMRQADLHRVHGIDVGSVVIEAWSDEQTFTVFRDARYEVTADGGPHRLSDFSFPTDGAWPDPKGMVDELHHRGIRVHLWQIPLMKMRPHPTGQARADADAAIRDGILIRESGADGRLRPYRNRGWWFPLGLMPDLTDARAAAWWTERRRYLVEEVGVDGFKTDGGEHAWGRELVYLDGRRGDEKNNTFPVAYAKAFGDLLRSAGKAPVTFSRAGFTGSQAHGAFWAGDENSTWEAFRWSMIAGLSAASSGVVYWGWDLAGFSGDVPDAELYLRAAAASAFVPVFQYHSEFNHHRAPSHDRTPWNIAERTGDERVIPVFRAFVELRMRLIPYLAEQARRAIGSGRPLMRPLYFDHPGDERIWDDVAWTLGDSILIAPVLEPGQESWSVYLPEGDWADAWTGERIVGGTRREVAAPIDRIPAFVRAADWAGLGPLFAT